MDDILMLDDLSNDRPRVLIVDDEPEIRDVLCELLGMEYDCSAVPCAEDAVSLVGTERFGLIISDITMGEMSGLEMIPHILKSSPETVVVMISGMQTVESAIEALRVGAFAYIMKPFD